MFRNWKIRIEDALKAIDFIKQDIVNLTFEDFKTNRLIRQATERNIEIIGEALNSVPVEIQEKYKEIPWRNIIGMRNYIIHQYFDIVPDIEWEVVSVHIYDLEKELKLILLTEK